MAKLNKYRVVDVEAGASVKENTLVKFAEYARSTNEADENVTIDNRIKAKYTLPSGGIPKSDLASTVQTSLGKADTALQQSDGDARYLKLSGGTMAGNIIMAGYGILSAATGGKNIISYDGETGTTVGDENTNTNIYGETIYIGGGSGTAYYGGYEIANKNDIKTYSAGDGLVLTGTVFTPNVGYTESGKNYAVKVDSTTKKLFVTVNWSDTNTAHAHSAGVGLTLAAGSGGTSGTTTYKAALASETLDTNAAVSRPTTDASKIYPVIPDKNGKLAVIVPWQNSDTNTWRNIKVEGVEKLGTSTSTGALNFHGGSNVTVSYDSTNGITIAASHSSIFELVTEA